MPSSQLRDGDLIQQALLSTKVIAGSFGSCCKVRLAWGYEMTEVDWVPKLGEFAAVLTDGARMHIGVTVVQVGILPYRGVQLWAKEYPYETCDVDKLFVQKIGDRNKGRIAVKGV